MAWRMEPSPKCANLTTTTPCARMHTREGKHLMSMKNIIKIIIYIIAILVMLFHGNRNPDWLKGLLSLNLGIWIAYYVFCSVILPGLACIFWSFFVDKCKTYPGSCCLSCIYWRCSIAHTVRMHRFTRLETVLLQWHCIKITRNDLVFESIGFWILPDTKLYWVVIRKGLMFLHKQFQ